MFGCFLNPFVKRPEFSSPSLRKHGGRMNRHALRSSGNFRRVASERRGAVLAVVIDNDDVELSGIVLFGKRIDALRDGFGFVACRNNHGDAASRRETSVRYRLRTTARNFLARET